MTSRVVRTATSLAQGIEIAQEAALVPHGDPDSGLGHTVGWAVSGLGEWAALSLPSERWHLRAAGQCRRVTCHDFTHNLFSFSPGKRSLSCRPPMVKLVCPADNPRAQGLECAKTCQNYDLECMSVGCVSGCLCPPGMVSHCVGEGAPSDPFPCRRR